MIDWGRHAIGFLLIHLLYAANYRVTTKVIVDLLYFKSDKLWKCPQNFFFFFGIYVNLLKMIISKQNKCIFYWVERERLYGSHFSFHETFMDHYVSSQVRFLSEIQFTDDANFTFKWFLYKSLVAANIIATTQFSPELNSLNWGCSIIGKVNHQHHTTVRGCPYRFLHGGDKGPIWRIGTWFARNATSCILSF